MSTAGPLPPLPKDDLDHILEHTRPLWEEMRGQMLFITGGTGFIGTWLLESFLHANEELKLGASVLVLTREPLKFYTRLPHLSRRPGLDHWICSNVRAFDFPEGEFPFVVHAAGPLSGMAPPLETFDTIVNGTRRVLKFAAQAHTRKLLFTSSGAVYGPQPPELSRIPETYTGAPDPLDLSSAYGEGKRAAEHLCLLYGQQYGFEPKIARCFAQVGPHLPENFAIGIFLRAALAGGPIKVYGDGTIRRSYLYASDLAIWLWTILFAGTSLRPYNVGSDQEISLGTLALRVRAILCPDSEVQIERDPSPGTPVSCYVPDVRRAAQELLCLGQHISLSEAIRKTAAWLQSAGKAP